MKNKITNFKKGDIIYATNITSNDELIDYESFICAGNNKFIESWYLGMIVNKNYIIDADLTERNIYKTEKTNIQKIGEISSEIINLFTKMNEERHNEINRL